MVLSRKQTAYRRNRKFGDVYGGRRWPKLNDRIFRRCHSIEAPDANADLPILMQDNPSRDFYFPISAVQAKRVLDSLPQNQTDGITHIWMRRLNHSKRDRVDTPLAEYICGSGVRLVVLYPWRRDGTLHLGRRPPTKRIARDYEKFGASISNRRGSWYAKFGDAGLKRFYIEHLLLHEIGHHVDWYLRHWGKANSKAMEEAADQYAIAWSGSVKQVVNHLTLNPDQ